MKAADFLANPGSLTQTTVAKKRAGQEEVDSDYLFGSCLQHSAFRSTDTAHESFIRAKAINTIQT
jgi:hypothetical protein